MASKAEVLQDIKTEAAKTPQSLTVDFVWKGDNIPMTFKRDLPGYIDLCAKMGEGKIPFGDMAYFFTKTVIDEDGETLAILMQNYPVEVCDRIFPQLLPMYSSDGKIAGLELLKKVSEPAEETS